MTFQHGEPEGDLTVTGDAGERTGTEITFLPSTETFSQVEFDFATLEHRLRELAFLNSGLIIDLVDDRGVEQNKVELHYEGGIEAFVTYLDRSKTPLHEPAISIVGEKDGAVVEAALEWTDAYHETMLCFTNNIPQGDGGSRMQCGWAFLSKTSPG